MLIAVLADTHNNQQAIRQALAIARKRGAETVIHCGDLGSPDLASLFRGWSLHLAFGNTDQDQVALQLAVRALGNGSACGPEIHLAQDGVRIAAIHGQRPEMLTALVASGMFEFIFHGHSHRRRDSLIGRTRVINPGALGGVAAESRSFCLLETNPRNVETIELNDACLSPE